MDSWEEGFDRWTPGADPAGETDPDLDRDELLRLARELAGRHQTPRPGGDAEVEALKQSLRERAAAVAERERELADLQRRLERPGVRGRLGKRGDPADGEAVAARERATLEREQALDERERAFLVEAAALEAEAARLAGLEGGLAGALGAAEAKLAETEAERVLAAAEREQLEQRDLAAHEREKALAAARVEIEAERQKLEAEAARLEARNHELEAEVARLDGAAEGARETGSAEPDAAVLAVAEERERALAARESSLDARERELALVRQGLDAERNALLERERTIRRREVAEVRESLAQPFAPPSFSDGLAALARARSRG